MSLDKGIFTISIDFEFAWGYADREISQEQREAIKKEVEITLRLLGLFDKYGIPATWAIVGHLLERDCCWRDGVPHNDFSRPIMDNEAKDWFWQHPAAGREDDVLWFDAENLLAKIRQADVPHEIASHSYAHLIYGDKKTNIAAIRTDICRARQIHIQNNLPFRSFVFPRNAIAQLALLKENGIICYRSNRPTWYEGLPGPVKRVAHLLDYYLPARRTAVPVKDENGLIAIADSLLLLGRNGWRKLVLPSAIVRQVRHGISQAMQKQEFFQLWFHPSNFASDSETQFKIFENILAEVDQARSHGRLDVLTLSQIAALIK